ncbi:MAG: DUF177 domain-containing protein [Proteobacteria bacterium]|nr:DUF177 domain-containing protein [Pseudomonadota bacterium]MDA1063214.1 DUF177 domain-containing protein [Pseudomonadota bacterium]
METDRFQPVRFDSGGRGPYHARAMGNPLLQRRAPQELAASRELIEIKAKVSDFERLSETIAKDLRPPDRDGLPDDWRDSIVSGQLRFGFNAAQGDLPTASGQAAVTIAAVCQRCLQPFSLPLQAELKLVFGEGGGGDYEQWELDDDQLCPADLIDEALVMALPLAAMHDAESACKAMTVAEEKPGRMRTPFAGLKAQMGKEN